MNKFVPTALAIAAAGAVTHADPGDRDWLELDSEISSLASSLKPSSQDGMGWTALLRSTYGYSSDEIATGGPADRDISGLEFEDVDVAFWGSVGDYGWRVSADIDNNEAGIEDETDLVLEDAYVYWDCGEYFTAMMGQFKPRILRSGSVDPEKQLFIDRTALGSTVDIWDNGIGGHGYWEAFSWYVAILNGLDNSTGTGADAADHLYTFRVEWSLGEGAGTAEGSMGGSDELNGTVGVAYITDDTSKGGSNDFSAFAVDVAGSSGPLGFHAEVASLDDDLALDTSSDFSRLADVLQFEGDSTPWSVTLSWLINPEFEAGIRYEDLDNDETSGGAPADDNEILTVGVSWYQSGNNAKWQAQWSDIDAASGSPDGSVFQVGVVVGASR